MSNSRLTTLIFSFALILLSKHTLISQCVDGGNVWDDSWVSCTKTSNPNPIRPVSHWLLFEFDQPESISESHIWNANRAGQSVMGVNMMHVDYSVDGTSWISLGDFNLNKAPEDSSYTGIDGPNFNGVFVKKILFTTVTTHGNSSCASLAEVQFNIDQTACYGVVDVCNVCNGPGKLTWYRDSDTDGLGDPENSIKSCVQPNGFVSNPDDICDTGVYGWADIGALFESNGCTGCHGNGGSGGLDLTSYTSTRAGGNKCGPNLLTGNNLVGIITIDGYAGCSSVPISGQKMNDRVGGAVDNIELAMIQSWINSGAPEFCQCPQGTADTDGDGVCDNLDACPGFDNALIGSSCDDGLDCTINDRYTSDCNCIGQAVQDSDQDGVCDALDLAPNNPCTADGSVDGIEPAQWTGSIENDCDGDGIPLGQGDLDDYSPCISQHGFVPSPDCMCLSSAQEAGGRYIGNTGVSGIPEHGGGISDGLPSGFIATNDILHLGYPYLPKNTEICFQIGFSHVDGTAAIELNDIGTYLFPNTAGLVNYDMQEFCIQTIEDGPQSIEISKRGSGVFRVDGSNYEYCPCSITDQDALSPDCQCPSNQFQFTGTFVSATDGVTDGSFAAGQPDNIFSGRMNWDTLVLNYPQLLPNSKICVTAGFSDAFGVLLFQQSGVINSFSNTANLINYEPQEFCFITPDVLTDNLLYIMKYAPAYAKIDGSRVYACQPCMPSDPDTDGDGVCDANDPCPNSPNDDYDNDGICDDLDICLGFDDNYDTDSDGMPNGCDICFGFDDSIDTDGDGVPNGCDVCEGSDDSLDFDGDGLPNGCDLNPCLNFITEITGPHIIVDKAAHIHIHTNGYVQNNANINYQAGHSVLMERGFSVEQGTTFHASIGPCSQGN